MLSMNTRVDSGSCTATIQKTRIVKTRTTQAMHTTPSIARFDSRRVNCSGSVNGVVRRSSTFTVSSAPKWSSPNLRILKSTFGFTQESSELHNLPSVYSTTPWRMEHHFWMRSPNSRLQLALPNACSRLEHARANWHCAS